MLGLGFVVRVRAVSVNLSVVHMASGLDLGSRRATYRCVNEVILESNTCCVGISYWRCIRCTHVFNVQTHRAYSTAIKSMHIM